MNSESIISIAADHLESDALRNGESLGVPMRGESELIYRVVRNMERYGGSFVKTLAKLYWQADGENQVKIVRTFHKFFEEYCDQLTVGECEKLRMATTSYFGVSDEK